MLPKKADKCIQGRNNISNIPKKSLNADVNNTKVNYLVLQTSFGKGDFTATKSNTVPFVFLELH